MSTFSHLLTSLFLTAHTAFEYYHFDYFSFLLSTLLLLLKTTRSLIDIFYFHVTNKLVSAQPFTTVSL